MCKSWRRQRDLPRANRRGDERPLSKRSRVRVGRFVCSAVRSERARACERVVDGPRASIMAPVRAAWRQLGQPRVVRLARMSRECRTALGGADSIPDAVLEPSANLHVRCRRYRSNRPSFDAGSLRCDPLRGGNKDCRSPNKPPNPSNDGSATRLRARQVDSRWMRRNTQRDGRAGAHPPLMPVSGGARSGRPLPCLRATSRNRHP